MSSEKRLRHVVLLKFQDEISQEQLAEVGQAFLALPAQIEAILGLEWGPAINAPEQFTHCLLVTVRNEADLNAYSGHPAHNAVGHSYGHLLQKAHVLDYWTQD